MLSLLTYPGGKQKYAEKFLALMPRSKKTPIVSPFMGGGSIEVFLAREGYEVYAGDHSCHIINFFKCLQKDSYNLSKCVWHLSPVKRRDFDAYKSTLQNTHKLKMPDFMAAAKFFIVNRVSFNGLGRNVSRDKLGRFNRNLRSTLQKMIDFDVPKNLHLYCTDYQKLLAKHPRAALFVDPPYDVKATHYGFGSGKETFDHERLAEILNRRRGRWILTYNDTPYVRRLYKGNRVGKLKSTVGYNNLKNRVSKDYKQVLIKNF
jgi:DNA adenine methylase